MCQSVLAEDTYEAVTIQDNGLPEISGMSGPVVCKLRVPAPIGRQRRQAALLQPQQLTGGTRPTGRASIEYTEASKDQHPCSPDVIFSRRGIVRPSRLDQEGTKAHLCQTILCLRDGSASKTRNDRSTGTDASCGERCRHFVRITEYDASTRVVRSCAPPFLVFVSSSSLRIVL
jgi:hypothetical protein